MAGMARTPAIAAAVTTVEFTRILTGNLLVRPSRASLRGPRCPRQLLSRAASLAASVRNAAARQICEGPLPVLGYLAPSAGHRAVHPGDVLWPLRVVELPVFIGVHGDRGLRLLQGLTPGDRPRHRVAQLLAIAQVGGDVGLAAERAVAAHEIVEVHRLHCLDRRGLGLRDRTERQ